MGCMERLAAWGRAHVLAVDAATAVLLGLLCAVGVAGPDASDPALLVETGPVARCAWSAAGLAPFAFRRRAAERAAWAYVAVTAARLLFGPAMAFSDLLAPIMLYSAVVYGRKGHAGRFLAAAGAMTVAAAMVWAVAFNVAAPFTFTPLSPAGPFTARGGGWLFDAFGAKDCPGAQYPGGAADTCADRIMRDCGVLMACIAVPTASVAVMAFWQRARKATLDAMRERNEALAAGRQEAERIAASAERARIARDMHDVVAHTLSTIIVQSDGGRYAGAHDLDVAARAMATIRDEARRAQRDMRRLFGVFRDADGAGYANIGALVDETDGAIRRVTGRAAPERLSPKADEAVFRLVQEALSNARRHAGAGANVIVDEIWSMDELSLAVMDDGRGAASASDGHRPGYGLVGMRERVETAGGTLYAGPKPNGGFLVAATLPLTDAPAVQDASDGVTGPAGDEDTAQDKATAIERSSPTGMDDPTHAPEATHAAADGVAPYARMRGRARTIGRLSRRAAHQTATMLRALAGGGAGLQDMPEGEGLDRIGRFALWTERHYLLMDVAEAVLFILMLHRSTYGDLRLGDGMPAPGGTVSFLLTCVMVAPLAFRRRFPESSALVMAALYTLQLLFLPSLLALDLLAPLSVYSAVLYGRGRAWRWVCAASALCSWLFGVKMMAAWNGYPLLARMLWPDPAPDASPRPMIALAGLLPGVMLWLCCLACVALARWARARGTDALVLRQRGEALRAERERRKTLAANLERERIGAAMQSEIAETLERVVERAEDGLAMVEGMEAADAERIGAAFAAIGQQGREALAHMRGLLDVLRSTGSSDLADEDTARGEGMALRPAAGLDEQMRAARSRRDGRR